VLPRLILISDAARVGEARFLAALEAAARAGLPAVLVREPELEEAAVERLVAAVRATLRAAGREDALVLVGRRPHLAARLGLDGVHLRGGEPHAIAAARELLGPGRLVGCSAHSLVDIEAAAQEGASHVFYSPIFGALSKQHPLPPVGLEGLRAACAGSSVPVYALGGVRPEHGGAVRRAGAVGAAMIGAVLDAADPGEAVVEFLRSFHAA
jgi:thiamine-phosphate pyrophosphorylase